MARSAWMTRRTAALSALGAVALLPVVGLPVAAQGADGVDRTAEVAAAIDGGKARTVILLIGDGMGDSEITSARNYALGADGRFALDTLPMTGAYTTYSVQRESPYLPDYVPDSAATGTAWATGYKSYDGAVSVRPDGTPEATILELARDAGYATGNVSSSEIQDATPAVLGAHVLERGCKGPEETTEICPTDATENGGLGSISEQLVETGIDVILGGGKTFYDQTVTDGEYEGDTVLEQAQALGYSVVTDADGLAGAGEDGKLLGLFAPNNLDLEWVGPKSKKQNTEPGVCTPNADRADSQPHLSDMAQTAIDILEEKTRTQSKGFFLQIESASIDKQDHASNACGQIGELVEFDKAVQAALDYQLDNPDTLVIVTADHAHTSQIVEAGSITAGRSVTLTTADGAPMSISYGTSQDRFSQQHTGAQLRIAASGPQAANVTGMTDQTDLFYTMAEALGLR